MAAVTKTRPKPRQDDVRTTVLLAPEHRKALDEHTASTGESMSVVVRGLLDRWMKRQAPPA